MCTLSEPDHSRCQYRPRAALKVAAIGNRRFAGEPDNGELTADEEREFQVPLALAATMKTAASAALDQVWQTVAEGMETALTLEIGPMRDEHGHAFGSGLRLKDFFSCTPPRLAVLTSLAAGADQIAAETALSRNSATNPVQVELEAVLPFAEADYPGTKGPKTRKEFRQSEADKLHELVSKIGPGGQVVRLDGIYEAESKAFDMDASHTLAYRSAADMLRQNADLLIAVYDPEAAARKAGSLETIRSSLASGMPVLAVLVKKNEAEARIALFTPDAALPAISTHWSLAHTLNSITWRSALKGRVAYLMALPHMQLGNWVTKEEEKRQKKLADTVHRLQLLFGDNPPHIVCRSQMLMTLLGGIWKRLLRISNCCTSAHPFEDEPAQLPGRDELALPSYQHWYRRTSLVSSLYMTMYRGFFVLSFLLAAVATGVAVWAISVTLFHQGAVPGWALWTLAPAKLAIISLLLWMHRVSHKVRPQELAVDFRYLAELLRPMEWLAPLGTAVPTVEMPAPYRPLDPRQGWMQWTFRAIARSLPCVATTNSTDPHPSLVSLDHGTARSVLSSAEQDWVQGQIAYHHSHAPKMHRLEHWLEDWSKYLLYTVMIFVLCVWGYELIHTWGAAPQTATDDGHPHIVSAHAPPFLAILLAALAAILPAFIAALTGILFQSEAARLKLRSEAMRDRLKEMQHALRKKSAELQYGPSANGCDSWQTAQLLRSTALEMILETGDWRALYQLHKIHAG